MKRIDMKNLFVSENLKTEFCFRRLLESADFNLCCRSFEDRFPLENWII